MRIQVIDGFRGFFLINMMIVHLNAFVHARIWETNHHKFGWVEDAQGFVFLSGLVIGIVYGKSAIRHSLAASSQKLWARITKIFYYHAGLIIFITLCALNMPTEAIALGEEWNSPWATAILSLGLFLGPKFIDILPMYIVFMAITPIALRMLVAGKATQVAVISIIVWCFSQTGLFGAGLDYLSAVSGLADSSIQLGLSFDRLAWQVFYFFGLIGGFYMAADRLDLSILKTRLGERLFFLSLALVILFFASKAFASTSYLKQSEFVGFYRSLFDRESISFLRVLNFAADAYAVIWLLHCGERWKITHLVARGISAVMNWKPLVFLGQHSLQVYAFHVFLFYGAYFMLGEQFAEMSQLVRSLLVLSAALLLFLPAYVHAEYYKNKRHRALATR